MGESQCSKISTGVPRKVGFRLNGHLSYKMNKAVLICCVAVMAFCAIIDENGYACAYYVDNQLRPCP
ncbi:unnamed protein product, partial [Brenthis ino]